MKILSEQTKKSLQNAVENEKSSFSKSMTLKCFRTFFLKAGRAELKSCDHNSDNKLWPCADEAELSKQQ